MHTSLQNPPGPSRVRDYLLAALALLPAVAFWWLARVALWPRLESLWTSTGYAQYTGLSGAAPIACAPDTMIAAVRALMGRTPLVFLLVLVVMAVAEFSMPSWSRLRRPALSGLVFLCTIAVFILFTILCISAMSTHPIAR